MNYASFTGRLVKDVETRVASGKTVAKYTIAVNREFKKDEADFIPCVVFGKPAEFAEKYFKKGMKVLVTGRIQTGNYKNKDGQTVYTTDLIVSTQEFLESKAQATASAVETPVVLTTSVNDFIPIGEGIEDSDLPF